MTNRETYAKPVLNVKLFFRSVAVLIKLRLTFLVVISAVLGYLIAVPIASVSLSALVILSLGGIMVAGASNGFNQIWERNTDKLMKRTQERPLITGALGVREALIICILLSLSGLLTLAFYFNFKVAILGAMALFTYVFIYTPMKKVSPLAVLVGAFPGAIPPMLGWVAATGSFGLEAGVLFAVQFMWQFPHFWAIAWVADDDYKKGGFKLLPFGERNRKSGFQILLYSLFLIPISLLPWMIGLTGIVSAILVIIIGMGFSYYALRLFWDQSIESA